MRIKIKGGTPAGTNLCDSCLHSTQMTYQNGRQESFCSNGLIVDKSLASTTRLAGPVATCEGWAEKGRIPLYEHEKNAWIIEVSKSRKIGFHTPKEWREKTGKNYLDLDDPF